MASEANQVVERAEHVERLPGDCVLISGAGPVGLVLATVLAHYGVKTILLERNLETTKWPKMDLTNARSMELFEKLGLADNLRNQGVPSHFSYNVLISSGLGTGTPALTQWDLPSVDQYRQQILKQNDGSLPSEPYQRISQAIFEAWLKKICDANPLIDARFGWKVESAQETESGARLRATDVKTGETRDFESRFIIGCDGASSRVRRDVGVTLDGGPIPAYALLVHFKSRDLTRLHRQGQFWHIFFPNALGLSGVIIAQDEVDTWTTHLFLPIEMDSSQIDSMDAVYTVLGGMGESYKITIDEILVRSSYRPSVCIATHYQGPLGHIFLAGDAAHQNIPTGGYGMNMGIGDAFDLGWKLSATIHGYGGPGLLKSYEQERRPVAQICIERSAVHMSVHMDLHKSINMDATVINSQSPAGSSVRQQIHDLYQLHDGENKDLGVEMGHRYKSDIIVPDTQNPEPEWVPSRYVPSTWPGGRAPHVFLQDGSPIFHQYGRDFTLIEFHDGNDRGSKFMMQAAKQLGVPLKLAALEREEHARKIWGSRLTLVRPDGHVSWRGEKIQELDEALGIVRTAVGYGK